MPSCLDAQKIVGKSGFLFSLLPILLWGLNSLENSLNPETNFQSFPFSGYCLLLVVHGYFSVPLN